MNRILSSTTSTSIRLPSQLDLPPSVRCRTLLSWTSQKADVITKLRIKVIEEVVSKVVKGVCTNQPDLSWFDASEQSLDPPVMHSCNRHTESIDDLSPNPQDLLNQAKARDLGSIDLSDELDGFASKDKAKPKESSINQRGQLLIAPSNPDILNQPNQLKINPSIQPSIHQFDQASDGQNPSGSDNNYENYPQCRTVEIRLILIALLAANVTNNKNYFKCRTVENRPILIALLAANVTNNKNYFKLHITDAKDWCPPVVLRKLLSTSLI
ncbi:hypothetical protein DFH28DRAFT_929820 [Melampsora americana]|nr:hypothetical protein DFH28DRAFT_929820 [Melampsora americana]